MNWPLSSKETAGVVTVGIILAWAARKVPLVPVVASGAALYTVGVAVGAKRPSGGYLG
jgi:hypothetical protein